MEMAIGLARQDPGSTAAQLDRVERESDRLDQLIGHILDYARLERDPSTLQFEDFDVAELVRQIVHDAEFESQSPPERLRVTSDDTCDDARRPERSALGDRQRDPQRAIAWRPAAADRSDAV